MRNLFIWIFGERKPKPKKAPEEKYKRCEKCNSKNLNNTLWNGGYNYLCTQATGRRGTRCYECGFIKWAQTDDEYEKTLPEWCKSHRQITEENKENKHDTIG